MGVWRARKTVNHVDRFRLSPVFDRGVWADWDAQVAAGVAVATLGIRPDTYTLRGKPAWLP